MTGDWKSEAEIKEELRILTSELRKLREELRDMSGAGATGGRRALHRPSLPAFKRGSGPDHNNHNR
jgi:hypothetical protein